MSEEAPKPQPAAPPTGGAKLPSGRTLGKDKKPLTLKSASSGKRFGQLDPGIKPKAIIVSALFLCVFITIGWYFLIKRPIDERKQAAEMELKAAEQARATAELNLKKSQMEADQQKQSQARGSIAIKTNPSSATVTLDDGTVLKSPANFKSVKVGSHPLKIALEGYEVVNLDAVVKEGEPTDLGTINLVRSQGTLSLQSAQPGVEYTLKDSEKTISSGRLPALIKALPTGDYIVGAKRGDYEITQDVVVIRNDTTTVRLNFSYATVQITSTPPGAQVRQGDREIGVTPLTLNDLKPGDVSYTLTLNGFKSAILSGKADLGRPLLLNVALDVSHDFTNSAGMEMVWIPSSSFWSGKFEVTQSEFEKIMGYRSGTYSGARRPVETVTWTEAIQFCNKLTELDRRSGKLTSGYVYALPTENQWETLAADASLDDSVTSAGDSDRNGTELVGSKKPNKYGIYDTRGNVWEMMSTAFDATGQRHVIRGGSWLTSKAGTLDFSYREGVLDTYRDKTIGFRCVLVKE